MSIAGISGISGLGGSYRISSIHGNPYSMAPIQRVGQNSEKRSGKPLVIASEQPEENLYVKDYGELAAPKSTATGDFAEMLGIERDMLAHDDGAQGSDYASYLNDTIGMMGLQNRLRDQLNGVGFTPFA